MENEQLIFNGEKKLMYFNVMLLVIILSIVKLLIPILQRVWVPNIFLPFLIVVQFKVIEPKYT